LVGIILVSGFEPFGGERVNPSARIAEGLNGEEILAARPELGREGVRARSVILPVTWDGAAWRLVAETAELARAEDAAGSRAGAGRRSLLAVVMLGQAGGLTGLAVERLAVNVANGTDNAGVALVETPIVPGGPAAYPSTLPLGEIVSAVEAAGLPSLVSNTAGTYLCNYVFYRFMHHLATTWGARPPVAGFIHIPCLPEQAVGKKPIPPSMSEADIGRAVRAALRAIATGGTGSPPG
jgi:pyroglutamyl-peptidase